MAYVAQNLPENEQNQQAPQGTTTPNPIGNLPPVTTGGSSGQASGGTTGGGTSAAGTSTQFAPSATKLSDYLSTNAPQAAQQGQTIAGNLTSGYNQAQGDINSAISGFGTNVQGGYTAANPDLVSKAASNPTDFAKDSGNVQGFQNLWNDTYTGPQNFESTTPYQNVQNEVQNAVSNAQNVQSPAGLSTYLNSQAKGNYLPGMATLDTALVQGSTEANKAIQDAAKPYAGLTDYLTGQVSQADQAVPAAQAQAAANKAAIQNQFTGAGGVIPTYETNLQNQTTAAQKAAQDAIDQEKAFLGTGNNWQGLFGNQQQLSDLGLTPDQYNNLLQEQDYLQQYGKGNIPNASQYLTAINPTVDINQANNATAQNYSDIAALQQLTGQDLSSYLNSENASQAGTAPTDYYNLNYGQMNTDLQNLVNGITPGAASNIPTTEGSDNSFNSNVPSTGTLPGDKYGFSNPILPGVPLTGIGQIGNNVVNGVEQGVGGAVNAIGDTANTAGNAAGSLSGYLNDKGSNAISDVGNAVGLGNVNLGDSVGLGGNTGVNNQWNEGAISTADPLIQYIAQSRGAPHGKDPNAWWNPTEMDTAIKSYINSLPADQRAAYVQNMDVNKLNSDMQKVYGKGWDFSPYQTDSERIAQGWSQGPVAPGGVRAF